MTGEPLTMRRARRETSLDVVAVSETDLTLVARLRDTSSAVDGSDDVEVIHDLRIDATVTVPELTIREITGYAEAQPYDQCAFTAAAVGRLAGLSLRRGYRREVMAALGGVRGCSHFLTLALGLSATTILSIYLRMRAETAYTPQTRADGTWAATGLRLEPGLMNACFALAEDSPVQRRALRASMSGGDDDFTAECDSFESHGGPTP